jgi:cytochrome c-type biogenesis protein CcmH/NrfG
MNEQTIQALREPLRVTPDNLPLRRHLAETLMELARFAEAEQEYRHALTQAPDDAALKIGLARAFYQQEKNSQALVIHRGAPQGAQHAGAGVRDTRPASCLS